MSGYFQLFGLSLELCRKRLCGFAMLVWIGFISITNWFKEHSRRSAWFLNREFRHSHRLTAKMLADEQWIGLPQNNTFVYESRNREYPMDDAASS